jgi:uncharacterized protein DUF2795
MVYRVDPCGDTERVSQVLAGMVFPAAKWQLVMYAEAYGADAATRAELWALPTGSYADLRSVLEAVAAAGRERANLLHRSRPGGARPIPGRVRPLR